MLEHTLSKVLLYIMASGVVVLLLLLGSRRRSKKHLNDSKYSLRGLLRQDKRLAQVVSHLSYFHDLDNENRLKEPLVRKKMKLILEMWMRIRKHCPDSSTEDVSRLCRQLISVSRSMKEKRHGKQ